MKTVSRARHRTQLQRASGLLLTAVFGIANFGCLPCNQQSDCPETEVCAVDGFCSSGTIGVEILPAVGRFSEFESCDVIATPPGTGLPDAYDQYLNCSGVPIVSMGDVSHDALHLADETVEFLVSERPDFLNEMIASGDFHILRGPGVAISDLPTSFLFADEAGTVTVDFNSTASTSVASFLFCDESEPGFYGSNQFVEIMSMHLFGVATRPAFGIGAEAIAAYRSGTDNGLWDNTFAGSDPLAYIGELSSKWLEVGRPAGPVNGDGIANGIITRDQLRQYDPDGATVMSKMWSESFNVPGCVRRNQVIAAE